MMHIKKTTLAKTTTAIAFGLLCLAGPTVAETTSPEIVKTQSVIQEDGASERINFSGKLRTLSQIVPAAACNLQAAVDPFKSSEDLKAAVAEFNMILNGLENGDASIGMHGAEQSRKTLAAIADVKTAWQPMNDAANALLQDASDTEAEAVIVSQSAPLLEQAKLLVSQISGQYSNPASLVKSDAIRIDIAGRQRLLTQQISKYACHMQSDIEVETARTSLPGAIQMFEISLQALRFGMPEAGIKASSNPLINDGLTRVAADWAEIRPLLATIEEGGTLERSERAELYHGLQKTMLDMNEVVGLYADASKLGL